MSISRTRAHRVHFDPNFGSGRAMACRPVGLCPPERLERGWSANRGARVTRVSAMRLWADGEAGVRCDGTSLPISMSPRGMGGRERCLAA